MPDCFSGCLLFRIDLPYEEYHTTRDKEQSPLGICMYAQDGMDLQATYTLNAS